MLDLSNITKLEPNYYNITVINYKHPQYILDVFKANNIDWVYSFDHYEKVTPEKYDGFDFSPTDEFGKWTNKINYKTQSDYECTFIASELKDAELEELFESEEANLDYQNWLKEHPEIKLATKEDIWWEHYLNDFNPSSYENFESDEESEKVWGEYLGLLSDEDEDED